MNNIESASDENYGYSAEILADWERIAELQRIRDSIYWKTLSKRLLPGSVLEVGAGCGQVSQLLKNFGFDVTSSDYETFFVEKMRSIGLESIVIDATDIAKTSDRLFDNIVAQSLSTQMRREPEIVERTYHSIHAALKPGGRFIFTTALYPISMFPWVMQQRKINYGYREQLKIIKNMSQFFDLIYTTRYQILKTSWYSERNKHFFNFLDFKLPKLLPFASCRGIFVLQKR